MVTAQTTDPLKYPESKTSHITTSAQPAKHLRVGATVQRAYTEGIGSSGFTRGALAATEPFDLVILPGPAVLVLSFFAFLLLVPPLFPSAALFYISQKFPSTNALDIKK